MKTVVYLSYFTEFLERVKKLDDSVVAFPETKLHPREVSKLVPSLISKTIVTHSEVIVNCLGEMIDKGVIDCKDVEIRILSGGGIESVYLFDKDGYLVDWPYGFFSSRY